MIENEQKAEDGTIKEPIKLRFKQLKDGNQSIYLDCYVNGIREYKFLNLYLRPDTSRDNKMWNKEQLRLANAIKWLPERSGQPASSRIFYKLPDQVNNADVRLRTIIKKAGISKHVTFHVARHTFATLTLTYELTCTPCRNCLATPTSAPPKSTPKSLTKASAKPSTSFRNYKNQNMDNNTPTVVKIHNVNIDKDYIDWIEELKSRYRRAQIKAVANEAMVSFLCRFGRKTRPAWARNHRCPICE